LSHYRLRRLLGPAFLLVALFTWFASLEKGLLTHQIEIDPLLLQAPLQKATSREPFSFDYKGRLCRVRPVTSYELWGLVVTHNNIESIADIYHDSTSVDTKDLCVVWGQNLESGEYRRVEYRSGPFTCYIRFPRDSSFALDGLGNNHLITADPAMRKQISRVRVGDQIHLTGLLVNYQMDDWEDFWRKTSTVRNDSGCEVVHVEKLEILRQETPGWYAAYRLGWTLLVLIPVVYLLTVWLDAGKGHSGHLGRL